MKTPIALALSAFILTSCAPYYDQEEARRQQDIADHNSCLNFGTIANSPAYDDCRRDLLMQRDPNYYSRGTYRDRDYGYNYSSYPSSYPAYPSQRTVLYR